MKSDLFSVVVLTYNQEDLVTETLDSIYNQSFKNIELVISDDASTDNTKEVITDWVNTHKDRFFNVVLNFNKENLGISGNHTKGIKLANGEFVKYIGGDDILLPDAINKMYDFLKKNPDARFCGSIVQSFYKKGNQYKILDEIPNKKTVKKIINADVIKQFRLCAQNRFIPASGTFFRKSIFEDYGYFDKDYRTFEDWHQWLKFLSKGERSFFLNEHTVLFRKHSKSVSASVFYSHNSEFYKDTLRVYKEYIFPNIDKLTLLEGYHILVNYKYNEKLIKKGISMKTLLKLQFYRMSDLIWWKELPKNIHLLFKIRKQDKEIFKKGD